MVESESEDHRKEISYLISPSRLIFSNSGILDPSFSAKGIDWMDSMKRPHICSRSFLFMSSLCGRVVSLSDRSTEHAHASFKDSIKDPATDAPVSSPKDLKIAFIYLVTSFVALFVLVEVRFDGGVLPRASMELEGTKELGCGGVYSLASSGVLVMGGGDGWRRDVSPRTEKSPMITLAAGAGEREPGGATAADSADSLTLDGNVDEVDPVPT